MIFTDQQIAQLNEPLLADDVRQREAFGGTKLSYIAGHHAISEANRIFGFGNWSTEILTLREVNRFEYIKPPYNSGDKEKPMVSIAYVCTLRLTVTDGDNTVIKEDTGFGDGTGGQNAFGFSSAIELSSKEAVTDAMKRCLRYFGNKFGLSLYDTDAPTPIYAEIFEATKIISPYKLNELMVLAESRGVDETWMAAWLAGEGWHEPLESLRQDWYEMIYQAVDNVGSEEREKEAYESDMANILNLIEESVNMNMLKSCFSEGWHKATKQSDKESQKQLKLAYDDKKAQFESNEDKK